MGSAEIVNNQLIVFSNIFTYGNAADETNTENIRDEIETLWNEPHAIVNIKKISYPVLFRITASFVPSITQLDIIQNLDPRNNYFRIEEFALGNISFVDGLGCNSGYFKLENLYKGSTTAAHEYGHTLGLDHPDNLDIRGKGIPGIMYPRGTLVDPQYQYDPNIPAGAKGGTLHPIYRKVLLDDINALKLQRIRLGTGRLQLGEFSNIWHPDHSRLDPDDAVSPAIQS